MRVHRTESRGFVRRRRRVARLPLLVFPAAALVAIWAGMTDRAPRLTELSLPQFSFPELPLPKLPIVHVVRAPGAVPAPGPAAPGSNATPSPAPQVHADFAGLLDPSASFGAAPLPLGRSAPLQAGLQLAQASPLLAADMAATPGAMASVDLSEPDDPELNLPDQAQPDTTVAEAQKSILEVPLPAPRPFELRAPAVAEPRVLTPPANRRTRTAVLPNTPADDRTFFEKLFGVKRSAETALGYAAPQDDVIDAARGRRLSPTPPMAASSSQFTAIYDIKARTVTMPNGERLEAHSGLGDRLDDPRFVHERMKGATPPHVYDLSLRRGAIPRRTRTAPHARRRQGGDPRARRPAGPHLHARAARRLEWLHLVPRLRQVPAGLSARRHQAARRGGQPVAPTGVVRSG